MENPDETIKGRLEIVRIEERQKEALKELDKLIDKIDEKNADLQGLRESEERYLTEIENVAKERVDGALRNLTKAGEAMADLEGKATEVVSQVKIRSKQAQDAILGLLGRIKEMIDKSDNLQARSEELVKVMLSAQEDLNKKIIDNSEFEKILLKREKEVEIKSKKAEEKLLKAKELAYWHRRPGVEYTEQ